MAHSLHAAAAPVTQRVLVCGAHRSGTTWLGEILSQEDGVARLYEPLNREVGIWGVRHWYPAANPAAPGPYDRVLDDFMAGGARFRPPYAAHPALRPLKYVILGNDEERLYRKVHRQPPERVVIKDPHATLAAHYLAVRHGVKVVCAVRHPAAFALSVSRMNWNVRDILRDLYRQTAHAATLELPPWSFTAGLAPAEQAGLFWRIINQQVVNLAAAPGVEVVVVRHEDLCADPHGVCASLAARLSIAFGARTTAYIDRSTSGAFVQAPQGQQHALTRCSAAIPSAWKATMDQSVRDAIRRQAEPVASRFYSDDDWAG